MTLPIKSRHGLTRCTSCRAHIRAADAPSSTTCPFCGASLSSASIATPLRVLGRSGLVAASLLAFSAAGCGGGSAADDTSTSADDTSGDQNGGGDQYADDPAPDNTAVAEYGVSPDQWQEQQSEDPRPMPRYGLPPSRR